VSFGGRAKHRSLSRFGSRGSRALAQALPACRPRFRRLRRQGGGTRTSTQGGLLAQKTVNHQRAHVETVIDRLAAELLPAALKAPAKRSLTVTSRALSPLKGNDTLLAHAPPQR